MMQNGISTSPSPADGTLHPASPDTQYRDRHWQDRHDVVAALGRADDAVHDMRRSILLIADGASPLAGPIAAAHARSLGQVGIADAPDRLDRLAQVDVVLLDCVDPSPALSAVMTRLDRMAADRDATVMVVCTQACLDAIFGLVTCDSVDILADPHPTMLAGALALALHGPRRTAELWDIARESEGARLERLSAEVGRLARVLDSLVHSDGGAGLHGAHPHGYMPTHLSAPARIADRANAYVGEAAPPIGFDRPTSALTASHIRDLLRARRQRDHFLPADLFADPAWDMMLDLMAARLAGERVSVSSLCIAAAVPPTTALRWIRQLTDRGLLVRQADPADGRRIFIALSDAAADAITRWFAAARTTLRDSML